MIAAGCGGVDADVNARGEHGRTAVTAAAMREDVAEVRRLIDAGADVDLQDDDRNNPLLLCGENGNVELLREVLRGEAEPRRDQPLRRRRADPRQRSRARRAWSGRCWRPTSTSTT